MLNTFLLILFSILISLLSLFIVYAVVTKKAPKSAFAIAVVIEIIVLVAIWGLSIVFLFIIGIMNQRKSKFKKRAMQGEVDMKNVLNSAFLAQKLYDELRVKYHPDRYLDEEQNREATEISLLLGKYKYDYEQLLKIKERAEESLGFRE